MALPGVGISPLLVDKNTQLNKTGNHEAHVGSYQMFNEEHQNNFAIRVIPINVAISILGVLGLKLVFLISSLLWNSPENWFGI